MRIEIKVPRCNSTSKNICPSLDILKRLFTMERCPELEMGRNSAIPCTSPSRTAFQMLIDTYPHGNHKLYITTFLCEKQDLQNGKCGGRL